MFSDFLQMIAVVGWCLAAVIALAVLFGPYEPAQGNLMTPAGSAAYNALHSTGWGVAVAWVIIACDCGYGGKKKNCVSKNNNCLLLINMLFVQ